MRYAAPDGFINLGKLSIILQREVLKDKSRKMTRFNSKALIIMQLFNVEERLWGLIRGLRAVSNRLSSGIAARSKMREKEHSPENPRYHQRARSQFVKPGERRRSRAETFGVRQPL